MQVRILAATQASDSDNCNKRYIHTRQNGRQFAGATDADCSDAATPAYQASLERFCANRLTTLYNFDPNNATLKPAHNAALDRFSASQRTGSAPIRAQRFAELSETDPAGISRRRAQAVSDYLANHGIASSRVTTESFGGLWARLATTTAGAGTRNRRVQISVQGRWEAGMLANSATGLASRLNSVF